MTAPATPKAVARAAALAIGGWVSPEGEGALVVGAELLEAPTDLEEEATGAPPAAAELEAEVVAAAEVEAAEVEAAELELEVSAAELEELPEPPEQEGEEKEGAATL